MYFVAPGKLSSGTRPPCFWNWGTAAGLVLNTRHGALPAGIAAPITSSEVLPAGISWAVTCSSGWAEFQPLTICFAQAISSGLFDIQILMGPVADAASPEPEPPPHAAVIPRARTDTVAARIFDLITAAPITVTPGGHGLAVDGRMERGSWRADRWSRAAPGGRAAGRRDWRA